MKRWIQINNLPIRYKLISHFLIISIIPIIALGILINWTVERVLEEQVNDNTLQLISKVNETFEFYINNMQSITYLIAFNEDVQNFFQIDQAEETMTRNDYDIQQFLRNFTTLSPEVAGILVVNNEGDYISNEFYAPASRDLTSEPWYQEAIENKGIFKIIGQPSDRKISSLVNYKNDEVVSVVRAVTDPYTQEVKGVILIDLKLRVIAETLVDVRLGKSGYLMVVDDQGENIYRPDDPLVESIPREWLEGQKSGTFSKDINEEKLQFIFQESPFSNWTTIGVFPTEETVFEMREIRFYIVTFVFFLMLFGIPVSYYLSYSLSKPITQLMAFMRKAESGQFHVRYKEKRDDEIGLLGRSFNKMLSQINDLLRLTERHERQKREAEFRSLQANINPHFLYNTLDTIQWMARKQKANDVAEVVESLAKLFRIGLSKGRDRITLEEEFDHIESYLLIQKTRYREKLVYHLEIEESLKKNYVLKFILQPLVENAIYHGIKERRGIGHIDVTATKKEDHLIIEVKDDGKGMDPKQLAHMQLALNEAIERTENQKEDDDKKGYGMLNVQARIILAFGSSYGLTLESKEGEGTTIQIKLPLLKNEAIEDGEKR
ncbi:cache domain-containing sensor histidine kinase [Saliterribacillus persicus]|uniref:histidine kinase n=1 Tax=Saliterribacillus persicus TaxID=930114 RepID=A0A368Y0H7_9BACI|nr:sensor histidine kinase [Saliterribacillus persicus]RCW73199.1 two-component system sensor histidine kinase YesM [Saliterribacillus persicus]